MLEHRRFSLSCDVGLVGTAHIMQTGSRSKKGARKGRLHFSTTGYVSFSFFLQVSHTILRSIESLNPVIDEFYQSSHDVSSLETPSHLSSELPLTISKTFAPALIK